jgi:hypothetical protein
LRTSKRVQQRNFGGVQVSIADLIVLGGSVGIEQAKKKIIILKQKCLLFQELMLHKNKQMSNHLQFLNRG